MSGHTFSFKTPQELSLNDRGATMKRALVLMAVFTALLLPTPAEASSGATAVRGFQPSPVAECMGASGDFGTYGMEGDLVGCWYIDTIVENGFTPSGSGKFSGTEHFVGCIDRDGNGVCSGVDSNGEFRTTFTFSAKFDLVTFAEIKGRCHHPIVGGSGAFANARGVINFHDNVDGGVVTADYFGPIRL
jgi:hypothetical protein